VDNGRVLLIRHALVDACGVLLAGRQPGVHLNREGQQQADRLGKRLSGLPITVVYSSPMERAQETAAAVANARERRASVPITVAEEINEVDFGEWTGRSFEDLDRDDEWRRFNRCRSIATVPAGEQMRDVQERAFNWLAGLRRTHAPDTIAIVSHGDVLRAIVARVLGCSIDRMTKFEIDPASLSVLVPASDGFILTLLNETVTGAPCGPQ
jgi:broad specificity phosphatase PhoE